MVEKKTTVKSTEPKTTKARAIEKARAAKAKTTVVKGIGSRHASGFIDFLRTQGVVGLAVGLAIGTAAGDTVKKLVEGFITPLVQLLVGSQKGLEAATWTLTINGRQGDFKWGAFVSSAITLLATALVIYLIVHLVKLDHLDKKKEL